MCDHYDTKRIVMSLKTKSKRAALRSSSHLSLELDGYWSSIRIKRVAKRYTKRHSESSNATGVNLSDALEHYLQLKGYNKTKLFYQAANRGIDYVVDTEMPYVNIKTNPKRKLKTRQSERVVPLVGTSFWAAKRVLESTDSEYVFTRYNRSSTSNSNSASAALNKWIKSITREQVVIHAFRHSMRDRLRAVECPSDIID